VVSTHPTSVCATSFVPRDKSTSRFTAQPAMLPLLSRPPQLLPDTALPSSMHLPFWPPTPLQASSFPPAIFSSRSASVPRIVQPEDYPNLEKIRPRKRRLGCLAGGQKGELGAQRTQKEARNGAFNNVMLDIPVPYAGISCPTHAHTCTCRPELGMCQQIALSQYKLFPRV
jgi:hypothetical protein